MKKIDRLLECCLTCMKSLVANKLAWVTSHSRPKSVIDSESLDWRGMKWPILWTLINIFPQLFQCLLNGPVYEVGWGYMWAQQQRLARIKIFLTSNAAECLTCQLHKAPDMAAFPNGPSQPSGAVWFNCSFLSWRRAKFFSSLEKTGFLSTYLLFCPRIFC